MEYRRVAGKKSVCFTEVDILRVPLRVQVNIFLIYNNSLLKSNIYSCNRNFDVEENTDIAQQDNVSQT